jgi:hypothetical protein
MDEDLGRATFLQEMLRDPRTSELVLNLGTLLAATDAGSLSDAAKRQLAGSALIFASTFFIDDAPRPDRLSAALREVGLALFGLNEGRPAKILRADFYARHPPKTNAVEIERAMIMALIDAVSIQYHRERGDSALAKLLLQELGGTAVNVFLEARNQKAPTKKPEQHVTDVLQDYRKGNIMDETALQTFALWRREFKDKFEQIAPSQWKVLFKAAAEDMKTRLLLLA